jgi:hypothetical protein
MNSSGSSLWFGLCSGKLAWQLESGLVGLETIIVSISSSLCYPRIREKNLPTVSQNYISIITVKKRTTSRKRASKFTSDDRGQKPCAFGCMDSGPPGPPDQVRPTRERCSSSSSKSPFGRSVAWLSLFVLFFSFPFLLPGWIFTPGLSLEIRASLVVVPAGGASKQGPYQKSSWPSSPIMCVCPTCC